MHGAKTKITPKIINYLYFLHQQLLCALTNHPFLVLIAWDQELWLPSSEGRQVPLFTDV